MKYYAKALEVISSEHDWYKICVEMAKKHPKAVVDAAQTNEVDWSIAFVGMGKIEAIKTYRKHTGATLKEAKNFVEITQNKHGFEWS